MTDYVLRGTFIECGCPEKPIRLDVGEHWRKLELTLVCEECRVDLGAALKEIRRSYEEWCANQPPLP